jgi:hypothetical protein
MIKYSLAVLLLTLSSVALAGGQIPLSWLMPTQTTDGQQIPSESYGSLAYTTIEYGPCTADGKVPVQHVNYLVPYPTTSVVITGVIPGVEYCFQAKATNSLEETSAPSNIVRKKAISLTPKEIKIN